MKKRVVIEFSERWLKAVVFTSSGIKQGSVTKIILEPLGGDGLFIAEPLSRIFKQIGQKSNLEVTIVLSRNKITVRQLDLPSRDPTEIESMLGLHVIRQVPYPKEEIVWSYQNLGFDGISNSHIILAIVHREVLRNIFNAFMSLNILPEAMTVSSQGVIHYLFEAVKEKASLGGAFLVLDIDYNFSELLLVNNQNLRSSVVISQGAEQLSGEEEKNKFLDELKQALVVLNNDIPDRKPTRIFLAGAIKEAEPLLKDILEKEFNLKFQVVKLQETKLIGLKDTQTLSLSAVMGFSYKRKKDDICFTLPEAQIEKEMKQKIKQLFSLGISLTYIFILLGALALLRIGQLQSYRDKLNFRIAKLKQDAGGIYDVAQKAKVLRQYQNPEQSVVNYIYETNRLSPDSITLTNINWEWQKSFSVRGYAAQMSNISSFVKELNNYKLFKGMQASYMRRRKIKGTERVDFEIAEK